MAFRLFPYGKGFIDLDQRSWLDLQKAVEAAEQTMREESNIAEVIIKEDSKPVALLRWEKGSIKRSLLR